ncbi:MULTISPECIES: rhodanese-like domain-containing protein [unclassified Imperialibacter]|jgi:phage shock protein E|uniref:rhodanese-like domain-containing protein n=1 Tax=unclassified Imperialibacter TaxID=2629706 RepID=UPI001256C26F|nr:MULTISPECIES: rhodanese-like domain-containing protein [unclassified Imperialibacter]CAD5267809.1 Rhodanese-related sulfurtransferase [Imperialibacter sp. 75]CAD5280293.1 Rhodanese-related sulfurtransferase [Imperialibacter sp. 89]VVT01355.1 Thiosulfate sulfurtransferase PspE [Imperialibacter sp. EC-SDR9]
MIQAIKNMLGMGPSVDLKQLVKDGAIIVDVRTKGEYTGGHVKGAINIPLQVLGNNLGKLKKEKTIITCCASGMRSGSAKSLLKSKGYTVHNGGGWMSLQNKLR